IRTGAQQDELAAVVQAIMNRVCDERNALLMVEPADVADDGLERILQPEPLAQRSFVLELLVQRFDSVADGDVRIKLRIPDIVIYAIEDSTELGVMHVERVAQAVVLG